MYLFLGTLYLIYKLRVSQLYDTTATDSTSSMQSKGSGEQHGDEPFAIQHISLCARSRVLAVSTLSNTVIVYRFRSKETAGETCVRLTHFLRFRCHEMFCSFSECVSWRQEGQLKTSRTLNIASIYASNAYVFATTNCKIRIK